MGCLLNARCAPAGADGFELSSGRLTNGLLPGSGLSPARLVPALESDPIPFAIDAMQQKPSPRGPRLRPLPNVIFASRWLQLPLYLGLILAQAVYVFHFWVELVHLIEAAFGNQHALEILVKSIGYRPESGEMVTKLNETVIMLVVLGLIDLLIMGIVGGYETFVSRLNLEGHPDQPEWLDHVNASVLKVKLGTAIIGISSIHLLKTFINAANYDEKTLLWQTVIHIAFLLSAIAIAAADRILHPPTAHGDH